MRTTDLTGLPPEVAWVMTAIGVPQAPYLSYLPNAQRPYHPNPTCVMPNAQGFLAVVADMYSSKLLDAYKEQMNYVQYKYEKTKALIQQANADITTAVNGIN